MAKKKLIIFSLSLFLLAISASLVLAVTASETMMVRLGVSGAMSATINMVKPEGRVGAAATNWDTDFYIKVRSSDGATLLFSQAYTTSTDNRGKFLTNPITVTGVVAGTYDIYLKGGQHLTRKMNDIAMVNGLNVLNFTQPDNSTATGTVVLLAGDINGSTTTPATMGDDVVNSVDLNIILGVLDNDDLTGNVIRANLNQDIVVNSVDLSMLIDNLDKEGDQ
jgi:hypothetical protein